MKKTIYKYPIQILDDQDIMLPKDAQIITVQMQKGQPHLWVLVDPTLTKEPRKLLIRGTGHNADDVGRYISTFQMMGGDVVFHVFEAL